MTYNFSNSFPGLSLFLSQGTKREKPRNKAVNFKIWRTTVYLLYDVNFSKTLIVVNKNALTAAFSLAWLEITSRNEEAINSARNRIHSLTVFYLLFYRRRVFFRIFTFCLFLNWFNTRVSDDRKDVCGRRLYACINTRKFKGLDSREITS